MHQLPKKKQPKIFSRIHKDKHIRIYYNNNNIVYVLVNVERGGVRKLDQCLINENVPCYSLDIRIYYSKLENLLKNEFFANMKIKKGETYNKNSILTS